jgi:hypothetical protein
MHRDMAPAGQRVTYEMRSEVASRIAIRSIPKCNRTAQAFPGPKFDAQRTTPCLRIRLQHSATFTPPHYEGFTRPLIASVAPPAGRT